MRPDAPPSALPRISVVTVVRNGAATIERCLRSVSRQAYPRLGHLIVDGASTDETVAIVRRHLPPVECLVSEPDAGIYDAMNKAVRLADGDFLLFLGADDELLADLGEIAPRLTSPSTVYYGDAEWPRRGRPYDGPFDAAKLARRNICQQAVLYPRRVFERYSFDLRYPLQADWELHMRLFADPAFRFQHLPVVVSRYDDAGGRSSRERDRALEADYPRLLWRHFPARVALPRAAVALAGRALRRLGLRGGGHR